MVTPEPIAAAAAYVARLAADEADDRARTPLEEALAMLADAAGDVRGYLEARAEADRWPGIPDRRAA